MFKIQFYKAPAQTVRSAKVMDIAEVYSYITLNEKAMACTQALREIIANVKRGTATDKDVRQYKASHFDFVTFSGTFSYRSDDCLMEHSGLLCLDFDHVGCSEVGKQSYGHADSLALQRLKRQLITDRHFTTWLLFTSPSGEGLKWVIEISLAMCDHKTWFKSVQKYVRDTYQLEVDDKCINVSRACFLPHDSLCYVNPTIFTNHPDICPF